MILQSLLFPDNNICSEEDLYFHREEGFILMDGYFNLFYLEKYHKYCNIFKYLIGRLEIFKLVFSPVFKKKSGSQN